MKTVLKAGLVMLALSASSAFAQGAYDPDSSNPRYQVPRHAARYAMPWEASTMGPAEVESHDIRNANSALWGVGG